MECKLIVDTWQPKKENQTTKISKLGNPACFINYSQSYTFDIKVSFPMRFSVSTFLTWFFKEASVTEFLMCILNLDHNYHSANISYTVYNTIQYNILYLRKVT